MEFNSNRTPSRSRHTDFYNQRRRSGSPYISSLGNKRYRSLSKSNSRNQQYLRNYNFSYRSPSWPGSRSASASRRFLNFKLTSSSEKQDHYTENTSMSKNISEINVYTTKMTSAITPSGLFCNWYFLSRNETDSNLPSRLEVAFQLDSSASISVLNIPS